MKETPILFSSQMVKAILRGQKVQTRRVMKIQPFPQPARMKNWEENNWIPESNSGKVGIFTPHAYKCPFGKIGDRLWVRETWKTYKSLDDCKPSRIQQGAGVEYFAGGSNLTNFDNEGLHGMGKWRPSIFMPRWASRINLEIINVRVERLNDISGTDCYKEGVGCKSLMQDVIQFKFKMLWDSINEKRGHSWESNPWVWVIEFKKL